MNVSFNGFNEAFLTFEADGTLTAGMPVMMSANGKVKACTKDSVPVGVVQATRGDYVSVQMNGYVTVSYTGTTAPTIGYTTMAGDGSGAVAVAASGRSVLVLDVDTTAKTCGIIL